MRGSDSGSVWANRPATAERRTRSGFMRSGSIAHHSPVPAVAQTIVVCHLRTVLELGRPRKTMACPTANLLYSYFLDTAIAPRMLSSEQGAPMGFRRAVYGAGLGVASLAALFAFQRPFRQFPGVRAEDVDLRRLGAMLAVAYEREFRDFASLLLLGKMGPRPPPRAPP